MRNFYQTSNTWGNVQVYCIAMQRDLAAEPTAIIMGKYDVISGCMISIEMQHTVTGQTTSRTDKNPRKNVQIFC